MQHSALWPMQRSALWPAHAANCIISSDVSWSLVRHRYCTPYTSLELSACRQQLYLVEVNGTEKLILEPRVAVMDCHITPSAKRGFARLHSNKHPSWGIEIPRECWQKILRLQRRETAAVEHSETDSTRLDDRCRSQQLDLLAAQPDIRTTTAPKRARHHRPRMTFSEVCFLRCHLLSDDPLVGALWAVGGLVLAGDVCKVSSTKLCCVCKDFLGLALMDNDSYLCQAQSMPYHASLLSPGLDPAGRPQQNAKQ